MVAATMTARRTDIGWAIACVAAIGYIVGMFLAGLPPTHGNRVVSEVAGVLTVEPTQIARIEIVAGDHTHTFARGDDGWRTHGGDHAEPVGPLIENALGLLHRAVPIRMLTPEQTAGVPLAAYGLAPPSLAIRLATAQDEVLFSAAFGDAVNDGRARYLRQHERAGISIVSGFVYDAWHALMH